MALKEALRVLHRIERVQNKKSMASRSSKFIQLHILYRHKELNNKNVFTEGLKSKNVTKFEVYGIIDVEWTRKKTELLKVMAGQTVAALQKQDIDTASTSLSRISTSLEKEVVQALERVEKSEFQLNSSYKKIENLNQEKDSRKTSQLLKQEEENFDKMYTDLKCQQANLERCLHQQRQLRTQVVNQCCHNFPNSLASSTIDEQEMQVMAEEIKDDYSIEDISPHLAEEYVEENNIMLVE